MKLDLSSTKTTKATVKKKGKTPVNPWLNAKEQWRNRYTSLANSQLWSMIIACVAVIMMLGAMAISIEAANRSQYVPYVVAVDNHGVAINSGFAHQMDKTSDKVVSAIISEFIVAARSVTVDISYLQRNIDWIYAHLDERSPARSYLNEWFQGQQGVPNPVERAQKELVSVDINSILKQGNKTYIIEWTEVTRARSGEKTKPDAVMKAVVSYDFGKKPNANDVKGIINNPLGLYVTEISWSKKTN